MWHYYVALFCISKSVANYTAMYVCFIEICEIFFLCYVSSLTVSATMWMANLITTMYVDYNTYIASYVQSKLLLVN